MVNPFTAIKNYFSSPAPDVATTPAFTIDDLNPFAYAGQTGYSSWENSLYDGSKFYGGFGPTQIQEIDYWSLRARSNQLFTENLYARGLIRRLVTNEINTGLSPEATPDESIIGVPDDSLNDWTETVENRFGIWAKNPRLCDWRRKHTFGALQRAARMEALIGGDVLVILKQSQVNRLPLVQLVRGDKVQTPLGSDFKVRQGNTVRHGVEQDGAGRIVAHWVKQDDGTFVRVPAFGEKSGRRLSWLVYGTEKRLDDVRGQPLLSLVLQSLKEIDRYRDSTQRKAVINSILAMFIEKNNDKIGSLPLSGAAIRRDQATVTDSTGASRNFNIANQIPGVVMEELQQGEKPVGFGNTGTDANFGTFEESIIQAVAWANEIPPEILTLAFTNNYSASQAAMNEFKIYLNKFWGDWGETFCSPIYVEWLLSEVLTQKIDAPGLLIAWRDVRQYDIFGAWIMAEWYGVVKISTDILKQGKGSKLLVDNAWSTNAREARNINGSKFSKNVKRLVRENQALAEAMRPILELKQEFGEQPTDTSAIDAATDQMVEAIGEVLEQHADDHDFIQAFTETLENVGNLS